MSAYSERLQKLRKAKRQSQKEVGKALGKSRETISKYELGERKPDPEVLVLYAKFFSVSADYILGMTDDFENTSNRKPFDPELCAFENYLKDEKFIPYLHLAVKMKNSSIEFKQFETFINSFLKQTKKQKHA